MAESLRGLEPEAIARMAPAEVDRLLDRLEIVVPRRGGWVAIPPGEASEMIVFGDTHGDWRSTREVVRLFEAPGPPRFLVGLGDYVDRAPADAPGGSAVNALYLAQVAALWPDRVFLLLGNHELARRIGVSPHGLPGEVERLWGPDPHRYERILGLLERGAVAATTENGIYLAHAGFPRGPLPRPWTRAFDEMDDDHLSEITWAECAASRIRRGASPAWGPAELDRFLSATGLSLVLRGHDPDLTGRSVYGDRVLTLQTTRHFERFGGVVAARVPLDRPVRSTGDLKIEHLPSEGRTYPSVG